MTTTRDPRIPLGLVVALASLGSLAILPSGLSGAERALAFGLPVVAGLTLTTVRPMNRPELFFHRYWLAALASWWLATLMSAVADGPCLWSDGFRLLGHAAVVLAVATSPHRSADGRTVGPVRQVQLTAVLLVLVALVIYGPGLAEGDLSAPFHAVVDLVVFAVAGWLMTRATTDRWRWTYGLLAVGFCLFGIAGLAVGHTEPITDIATAMALVSFAGVPRRPATGAAEIPDRAPVESQKLPFEIPVFVSAIVLPCLHLGTVVAGVDMAGAEQPAVVGARGALTLATLLALGGLAFVEHVLLRRRATHLEVARDRAADEEAERSIYLTSLIEHSPLAIVVLDPDHIVQLCNPAFEKLFEYTSGEVVGASLDRLIAPGEQAIEARGYTRRVLEGATVHDTTVRLRRDGTPIDVEIHGVPLLKDGELVGIFALYQDVTERIHSEEALRESEERFRRLSDATFEGIVVSEQGRIVDCNEQYAQLVGLPRDEVLDRRVLDFVDPVDHAMVLERLGHDDDQAYEHRALRADRSALIVEVHARNIPWNGRHVRVAAVRDVTGQRRFEEEVRQSQKMEAVGRLAGGIAHDFNNLLTVIKGYAQLLFLQMAGDKRSDLVDEIVQATDRASLMTQRLLAFGRKQPFQPQTLDLADAVRSMEKILRRLIRADIQLVFDLVDGDGRARVDPGQFEQVILNLAINAADAMPSGGTLTLATDLAEVTEDELHQGPLTAPGSYVRLRVRDTGTGMDEATRKQVFEPFFTTKTQGKGTGLGLATVYAIVHQSGGAIEVRSAPGKGSEFTIVWPRVLAGPTEPAMTVREPAQRSDLPAGSETVLVVEDEPGVRLLAREFLELQGYRVHVAEDGTDGLERFEKLSGAVDLVLTDVVMPGMNGPEMIQRLHDDQPELRVLYMSGYTDEILAEAGSPTTTLVHKPFSVEELVTKVREILDSDASAG